MIHYIRNSVSSFMCDMVSAGIILQKSKMYHATVCAERKNRALVQLLKVVTQEESALSTIIGMHHTLMHMCTK
jgi:hypothetical protein